MSDNKSSIRSCNSVVDTIKPLMNLIGMDSISDSAINSATKAEIYLSFGGQDARPYMLFWCGGNVHEIVSTMNKRDVWNVLSREFNITQTHVKSIVIHFEKGKLITADLQALCPSDYGMNLLSKQSWTQPLDAPVPPLEPECQTITYGNKGVAIIAACAAVVMLGLLFLAAANFAP